jgi:hypothetical protein
VSRTYRTSLATNAQIQKDIHNADTPERMKFWHDLHTLAFPLATSIEKEDRMAQQLSGVDRVITFPWGKTLSIEEKLDATRFTDSFTFETVSNAHAGTLGWCEKPQASQVFVYAHEQNGRATYFDTRALFECWHDHKREWIAKYKEREVRQSNSKVVPVPLSELYALLPTKHKVFRAAPLIQKTTDLATLYARYTLSRSITQ